jgi:PadR family transcriptional regulator, regulatory protein PadR
VEHQKQIVDGLVQELRRGSLVVMVLSQLAEQQYGYSLVQRFEEQGLNLDPGTLYPLLRRLEKQGLLLSQWDTEGGHPRRYYSLSPAGHEVLTSMAKEWQSMSELMQRLLPDAKGGK